MTVAVRKRCTRPTRQREGAVMLIVLLILLTATTLAATSLQTTQFELRAAGYNRAALQTQYVSEAAAMTTLAWLDATAMDRSFLRHLQAWNAAQYPPDMAQFGEPEIPAANRANANRTQWVQQELLTGFTMPPMSPAGYVKDAIEDKVGSMGPRSSYVPGIQMNTGAIMVNYVVDMYDCRVLSNTASAGYQVNQGGSGTMRYFQYYCVVTSRGRAYVPDSDSGTTPKKTWTVSGLSGQVPYVVNRFTMAHDSRGAVITAPMSR